MGGLTVRSARNPVERLRAQTTLASMWRASGRYREAGLLLRFSLPAAERVAGPRAPMVARICNEWGMCARYSGDFGLAERLYQRALEIYEAAGGPVSDALATVCHNIGGLANARGRYAEGEPWARRAWEIRTELLGAGHLQVTADRAAWAALLVGCERHELAEEVLNEALAAFEQAYGPDHREVAVTLNNLAALDLRRGDHAGAEAKCRRALEITERLLGAGHPECALILINLGRVSEHPAAHAAYGRAVEILERSAPDHPHLLTARSRLGSLASR